MESNEDGFVRSELPVGSQQQFWRGNRRLRRLLERDPGPHVVPPCLWGCVPLGAACLPALQAFVPVCLWACVPGGLRASGWLRASGPVWLRAWVRPWLRAWLPARLRISAAACLAALGARLPGHS